MKNASTSYRGIVAGGVVVLQDSQELDEGTAVEVRATEPGTERLTDLRAFGLWKDRTDLHDAAEASLELRRQIEQRRHHE